MNMERQEITIPAYMLRGIYNFEDRRACAADEVLCQMVNKWVSNNIFIISLKLTTNGCWRVVSSDGNKSIVMEWYRGWGLPDDIPEMYDFVAKQKVMTN